MDNLSLDLVRSSLKCIGASNGIRWIETAETFVVSGTFEQVKEAYVNVSQSANDYNICNLITVTYLQLNKCITD